MDYDFKFKKDDWLYIGAILVGIVYIIVKVIQVHSWF